jgi:hypothetical protein
MLALMMNFVILMLGLTALYAGLGALGFALEHGTSLLVRRPRRRQAQQQRRVRRRSSRRRAAGATAVKRRARVLCLQAGGSARWQGMR